MQINRVNLLNRQNFNGSIQVSSPGKILTDKGTIAADTFLIDTSKIETIAKNENNVEILTKDYVYIMQNNNNLFAKITKILQGNRVQSNDTVVIC